MQLVQTDMTCFTVACGNVTNEVMRSFPYKLIKAFDSVGVLTFIKDKYLMGISSDEILSVNLRNYLILRIFFVRPCI